MRLSVVGSVALALGLSTAALADGMPTRRVGVVAYEAPYSWTGLYVGANVGYSWGRADTGLEASEATRTQVFRAFGLPAQTLLADDTVGTGSLLAGGSADVDGWLGGGQIGFNWQARRWVLGIEADIQATGEKGSITFCSSAGCGGGSDFLTARYKLDWFGTVRARIGFLLDPRLLIYATGGLAYGHLDADFTAGTVGEETGTVSDSKTHTGWVLGGGVEWAMHKNWHLRAEYMYMDLGEVASVTGSGDATTAIIPGVQGLTTVIDTTTSAAVRTDFTDQIFRIGLSYKFGGREYRPLK